MERRSLIARQCFRLWGFDRPFTLASTLITLIAWEPLEEFKNPKKRPLSWKAELFFQSEWMGELSSGVASTDFHQLLLSSHRLRAVIETLNLIASSSYKWAFELFITHRLFFLTNSRISRDAGAGIVLAKITLIDSQIKLEIRDFIVLFSIVLPDQSVLMSCKL